MPNENQPYIPEYITLHLGRADANAQNVTVAFADYIKNVASSEIYPTWPESALRANILAQISFALNRVYTQYYRSRGYDFDITNSTASDQSFINGRDIFDNISRLTDELFDEYIRRRGATEPLFAQYCDGIEVSCDGLSQWGSVSLAEDGLTPYEILTNYYGSDIDIVRDAPIRGISESYPGRVLETGSSGNDVKLVQIELNRISKNYPNIPKIRRIDGRFGSDTERAVREFQAQFDLAADGRVGRATWYKIGRIYTAVKKLADINSEGISPDEITGAFERELTLGSEGEGVVELQYQLSVISVFVDTIPEVAIDGIYGEATRNAVLAFQQSYGFPQTGSVDTATWEEIYRAFRGMIASLPDGYFGANTVPFSGIPLKLGSSGDEVRQLQEYLNYISDAYPSIQKLSVDGEFGESTENAVREYQRQFDIEPTGIVGAATWLSITDTYRSLYEGNEASEGQFSGEAGNE